MVVHPLVLLSVVDHFNRTSKVGNVKRVVGLLLGCLKKGGVLDISNSFAIPFDEDDKVRICGRGWNNVWFMGVLMNHHHHLVR